MVRFWLKLTLLLSVLCLTPVLLIRAQPYDDGGLRAFLTPPEGCPAPCFMGIRPGGTSPEDALMLLRASGFVDAALHAWSHPDNPARIDWTAPDKQHRFQAIRVDFNHNLAAGITVSTNFSIAEVRLSLGDPDFFHWTTAMGVDPTPVHLIYIEQYSLYNTWVHHAGICPYQPIRHRADFRWIRDENWPPPAFGISPYTYADFLSPARELRHHC